MRCWKRRSANSRRRFWQCALRLAKKCGSFPSLCKGGRPLSRSVRKSMKDYVQDQSREIWRKAYLAAFPLHPWETERTSLPNVAPQLPNRRPEFADRLFSSSASQNTLAAQIRWRHALDCRNALRAGARNHLGISTQSDKKPCRTRSSNRASICSLLSAWRAKLLRQLCP